MEPREEGGGPLALAPSPCPPRTSGLDAHQPLPEASKPPRDHDSFTIRYPEVTV